MARKKSPREAPAMAPELVGVQDGNQRFEAPREVEKAVSIVMVDVCERGRESALGVRGGQ